MSASRNEAILLAVLNNDEYDGKPESRIEALLIAVAELIKIGGSSPGGYSGGYKCLP